MCRLCSHASGAFVRLNCPSACVLTRSASTLYFSRTPPPLLHSQGDLGNIVSNPMGLGVYDGKVSHVSLSNFIGRTVVVHRDEDDCASEPVALGGAARARRYHPRGAYAEACRASGAQGRRSSRGRRWVGGGARGRWRGRGQFGGPRCGRRAGSRQAGQDDGGAEKEAEAEGG